MTADAAVYRRVLRRETHAARTVPASIVASLLIVLVLGALVLSIWALIDSDLRESLTAIVTEEISRVDIIAVATGAGIVLVLAAVPLIAAALLPGRRSRRARVTERIGVVIDDGVLADVTADRVAASCGVDRSQVSVTVGRRSAVVRVTPTSGLPLDEQAVREAASEALSAVGFETVVKVSIAEHGMVS